MKQVKISVFGLGPVGLATAVCLAKRGHTVTGIDPDLKRVEAIRNGASPFAEPALDSYLKEAVKNKLLQATSDSTVNAESDIAYIAVGTPGTEDCGVNLEYVRSAATAIGRSLRRTPKYQLVVVKSTVLPGTVRGLVKPTIEQYSEKKAGEGFGLCSNPEFLREGSAVHDSEHPDRVIIGGEEPDAGMLEAFYRQVFESYGEDPPIVKTSYENAELTKYANNAFLAMKISYINMIANICQKLKGSDVKQVAKGVGLDDRIGSQFLNAGLGWGGSCFAKDLSALARFGKSLGVDTPLVDAALEVNSSQPMKAVELAEKEAGSLDGKRVAVLGLAFKPDTDDMRGAVSIPLVQKLLERGAQVVAYDPIAMSSAKKILRDKIEYAGNAIDCITGADCCIVVTEWKEFTDMLPTHFTERMKTPVVIDGRRIYDPAVFTDAGIRYSAMGLTQ